MKIGNSNLLKICLFATGLSGIVAEYILSTLATYFLGDSILQWTLILSFMLFAMGLGSRISKSIDTHLLEKFIIIEIVLSIVTSFSALLTYSLASQTNLLWFVIYTLAISVGLLIGMEIPLVTRINEQYEDLKGNISSVMENDYYGSLIGGLFFAFIGLPFLGLTYTPFVLGLINFSVAGVLLYNNRHLTSSKFLLKPISLSVLVVLILGFLFSKPIVKFGEQSRYKDKVVFSKQSKYQKLTITQWKNDYWFFINDNEQLSTFDEWLYHEPMVHPLMSLHPYPKDVLILGGGDGCIAREVLKYETVENIVLVDLDPEITNLAKTNPIFTNMNKHALNNPKVSIVNQDAFIFVDTTKQFFDAIFIDFPDPKDINLNRLFSSEFFFMCKKQLKKNGYLIIQSGSPYYASEAFYCIQKTLHASVWRTQPRSSWPRGSRPPTWRRHRST